MADTTVTMEFLAKRLDIPEASREAFIKGELTPDDFETGFKGTWIGKVDAMNNEEIYGPKLKSEMGKKLTLIDQTASKAYKDFGIEFTEDELKPAGKPLNTSEKLELGLTKMHEAFNEAKQSAGIEDSEKVKTLEQKITNLTESRDTYQTNLLEKTAENEQLVDAHKTEYNSFRIGSVTKQEFAGTNWKDGITAIEKRGLQTLLQENIKTSWEDTEDGGKVIPQTVEGKPLMNEQGSAELTYREAIDKYAAENKLLKMQNDKPPSTSGTGGHQNGNANTNKKREIIMSNRDQ